MNEFMKKHLGSLLGIVGVIVFSFRKLPNSFFEQDEWHSFGYYIKLSSLSLIEVVLQVIADSGLTHFTPLSLLFKRTLYLNFGVSSYAYFIVSLAMHIAVSVMLYLLFYRIFKNRWLSFLGTAYFATNVAIHQGVTWLGTFEGVMGASLFGLISIYFAFLLIESKVKKKLLPIC